MDTCGASRDGKRYSSPTRECAMWGSALLAAFLTPQTLWGVLISDLSNTGVDASGTPLADNDVDPHYTIIAGAAQTVPLPAFVTTGAHGFLVGP